MKHRGLMGRGFRRVSSVLGATALVLALAACGSSDDGDSSGNNGSSDVRIAYLGVASWLPAMVAEEKGYFEDEGLNVTSEIVANLATLPGAMGRQFDIASTTIPDTIRAQANGVKVEVVAGQAWETEEHSIVRLLAHPDSGVKSVKDLAGKRIGAGTLGGNIHPATQQWLVESGVSLDDVTFSEVPFPQQPAQLSAKSLDAVEALEPFASAMLAEGAIDLGSPLLAIGDPISISSWMASSDWAADNEETIKKFVAALTKANEFILENEDEAREILQKRTELPEAVAKSVKLPMFDFTPTDADFQAWKAVIDAQG